MSLWAVLLAGESTPVADAAQEEIVRLRRDLDDLRGQRSGG